MSDVQINMSPTQVFGGLYIGDIEDVREGDTSKFDRVIGVCQDDCSDNVGCEYEHFALADGPTDEGNRGEFSYELLSDAIDAVVAARLRRETVLVHCHMGVSRSVCVCIGALAIIEGMTYDEALDHLRNTKYIQPKREVLEATERYVEERA